MKGVLNHYAELQNKKPPVLSGAWHTVRANASTLKHASNFLQGMWQKKNWALHLLKTMQTVKTLNIEIQAHLRTRQHKHRAVISKSHVNFL